MVAEWKVAKDAAADEVERWASSSLDLECAATGL